MKQLEIKIRVSVLWIATVVADLVQIVLSFMGPGFLSQLMQGKIGNMTVNGIQITVFSFSLLVPVAMSYLVFCIKDDRLNQRINVAMAILIAAMSWLDFLVRIPNLGVAVIAAFATNIPPTLLIFVARRLRDAD
jgi:hypothetical protein